MSTLRTDTLSNSAGSASVPVNTVINGSAKAWVNFNGTGTVAIRQSFNVSSITDNGTGDYTVNFTTAMPDANYSTVLQSRRPSSGLSHPGNGLLAGGLYTSSGCQIETTNGATTKEDHDIVSVSFFR